LAGRLKHKPRWLGTDQVTGLTRWQRIRWGVERRVLRLVTAIGMSSFHAQLR
jgi:hypothetical protein